MKINVRYEEGTGLERMAVLPMDTPVAYREIDGRWFVRWVRTINIKWCPF